VGTGTQSAVIEADLQGVTPPEKPDAGELAPAPTRMPVRHATASR